MTDTPQAVIHRQPDSRITMTEAHYHTLYNQSLADPLQFWGEQAHNIISWFRLWDAVSVGDFAHHNLQWFVNGQLNACYNCVDRHLETCAHQLALVCEGNNPDDTQQYTYQQLHHQVCLWANVLKSQGVLKGDRVVIYLPMIAELVIVMLACARIGAVHSVVFSGFSADALKVRLLDIDCAVVITADEGVRGDKIVPLKQSVDTALQECANVKRVIVVKKTGHPIDWLAERDRWSHDLLKEVDAMCPVEWMDAADPLFILYTSGSTGKPKGVVHATGGYLVYVALTYQVIFDHRAGDVLFCTADPGWITGHSYLVYGPLANGATTILYEGVPSYPNYGRYWDIIDKHQVTQFYTSPTALRTLRHQGEEWINQSQRHSLRVLGSVGEPISPDVWDWYYHIVGKERCPIVNTWWQTETGGILISAIPGMSTFMPGSAGLPFLGIQPEIVDEHGAIIQDTQAGRLVIKQAWPGMMVTIWGDEQRFIDSYFKDVPGYYLTGDSAQRDDNGYLQIAGRNDDVIKVSGHRLGSEELESALMSHHSVSEVAVVGAMHDIKGECVVAFVTLRHCAKSSEKLQKDLKQLVRDRIGALAVPDHIYWTQDLPKTRSGKIMRRILRHIANHQFDTIGDVSTLVDPNVVSDLIITVKNAVK